MAHPQMLKLVERKVIEPGLFDERHIAEVSDPEQPAIRYLLCRNPLTAEKESQTRQALIGKSREALEKLVLDTAGAAARHRSRRDHRAWLGPLRQGLARSGKQRTAEQMGAAVGVALAKWKVGKFFAWKVVQGALQWTLDESRVAREASLDGCYVVRTDATAAALDKRQAVAAYRQLAEVDRGFRQLKTVALEIRPVFHQKDERIEAHVFLCLLAYYVQWHMQRRLAPLFAGDGQGQDRRWPLTCGECFAFKSGTAAPHVRGWTFAGVLERLKSIREQTVVIQQTQAKLTSTPDEEQRRLLDLLSHPTAKDQA